MKNIQYTFKRNEVKYIVNADQKRALLKAIGEKIYPDDYARYTICNLYCDTPDSRLIRKSIEKPAYKEKMRIRSYGQAKATDPVFVELKKKYQGIVYKRRMTMLEQDSWSYFNQQHAQPSQIEKEMIYFLQYYKTIRPMMYIAYDREEYSGKAEDGLRITFDDHILWRTSDLNLRSEVYGHALLEEGTSILEIKVSNAMPLWLTTALSENQIYKTSFSKYGKAYTAKTKKEQQKELQEERKIA